MNESEIKNIVEKFIIDNNLAAKITNFENSDDWNTVDVEVERKDYDRALICDYNCNFSIRFQQKIPELIGAEIGDLVLIFNEYHATDEESDVGLVSAKYTEENGNVYYGCRYIKIALNNTFVSNIYDFELSEENYGGYPTGFLKVLTSEEAINHLQLQLKSALEEELKKAKTKFDNSMKNLPNLVASLGQAKRVKCDKLDVDEIHFPLVLNIRK